jgi:peptidyl-prolyl cis-trans isomerase C
MAQFSRLLAGTAALAATLFPPAALPAFAQGGAPATPPAATAPAATPQAAAPAVADPVVARVDGQDIRLSDVAEAAQGLPSELRNMPPNMIFPMLIDQLIDRRALAIQARRSGLDSQPDVKKAMDGAAERALQNAYISRQLGPQVNDQAVRALYERDIAGKPGAEEVQARHILVANEELARRIIADLKKGGDFAALAKQHSTDPSAQTQGGDLGFFKKDDMVPEFANAAFALKPGEITENPVKTQFGWHVIKVENRRAAPTPSFEESRDELRQKLIQESFAKLAAAARAQVQVERMNMDGSPQRATDGAQPPPPPGGGRR